MEKVKHVSYMEFIYDSEQERLEHINKMVEDGWQVNHDRKKRLDPSASLWDAGLDVYQWYGQFWRYGEY